MALEILSLVDDGEWTVAQCAVNGTLAVPFSFHKATKLSFKKDIELFDYLERQANALIEAYGDARKWPEQGRVEIEGDYGQA